MTAETTDRPDPSAKAPRTGLSPLQVLASGLAAASAAVVASFFGVAGTVIGAALGSLVTTVSAALCGESLRRTSERVRRLRGQHGATGAADSAPTAVAPLPQ